MSSIDGMRKAKVLPLPVLAAARTSLQRKTSTRWSQNDPDLKLEYYFYSKLQKYMKQDRSETYLPSSRGRILLCWISVMCSKPISFTAFRVLSLTRSAREAKDVSSNAPETSVNDKFMLSLKQILVGAKKQQQKTAYIPGRINSHGKLVSLQLLLSGESLLIPPKDNHKSLCMP